jgi:hypothetical protein
VAVGLWIGMSFPASAADPTEDSRAFPHIGFTYDQIPGPQLTPIVATVGPSGATGTVQFTLNGVDLGPPVALVNGRAESIPVDIPDEQSYAIFVEYSGDAFYLPMMATLHSDWRGSEPEPSSPAAPAAEAASPAPAPAPVASPAARSKVLARTGSETVPLAALASFLLITGLVMSRAGRPKADQDR